MEWQTYMMGTKDVFLSVSLKTGNFSRVIYIKVSAIDTLVLDKCIWEYFGMRIFKLCLVDTIVTPKSKQYLSQNIKEIMRH